MITYEVLKAYGRYKIGDHFDIISDPQGVYKEIEQKGFIRKMEIK